jgi:hypothetical protein
MRLLVWALSLLRLRRHIANAILARWHLTKRATDPTIREMESPATADCGVKPLGGHLIWVRIGLRPQGKLARLVLRYRMVWPRITHK